MNNLRRESWLPLRLAVSQSPEGAFLTKDRSDTVSRPGLDSCQTSVNGSHALSHALSPEVVAKEKWEKEGAQ